MFNQRLAIERKRLGLTQADVASILKVGRSSIAMYESGKSVMDVTSLSALVNFLKFDLNYLINGQSNASVNSKEFDWELLATIQETIRAWAASKSLTLSAQKEIQVLKLLHEHFSNRQELDKQFIYDTLNLAA